jgi:hypothetical protein
MKMMTAVLYWLGVPAVTLLVACSNGVIQSPAANTSASQSMTFPVGAPLRNRAIFGAIQGAVSLSSHRGSWMSHDAKQNDLLYATSSGSAQVYVYSYPSAKLEGILTGAEGPESDCIDKAGNIWIPDASRGDILKYAHGGTSPIAVLNAQGNDPFDCSVDPTTGNLAVINIFNVLIFRKARGTPTTYSDPGMPSTYFGGYDNLGNLFVDGTNTGGTFQFAELPKGSSGFTNFSLSLEGPGGVQWDGKYIDVGDFISNKIYQVQVNSSGATIVGSTLLSGAHAPWYQFTFPNLDNGGSGQAKKIIATDYGTGVASWNYPAGGYPLKVFDDGPTGPTGVVISPARK